ncbi:hypothetical protein GCM10009868_04930 [Terrabacter aerolatus]|uniref:Uncharacterized protein n=1 Tax=Terrabacter aerolatus TaxID=422442 RepID=A0A512CZ37_9MICO|nr:hypothetical protein [Terrabacter aerolatus]GEO29485.1 hypothetical protein TAE01_12950 [Terrabacter aerolatus]
MIAPLTGVMTGAMTGVMTGAMTGVMTGVMIGVEPTAVTGPRPLTPPQRARQA